ncbi:substrate-binding domain-containing protein [Pseudothauera rhizosphaerae]|nr:substrate-binding domain-containing protein [Pseudothauera rhizosphaerae]
MKTFKFKALSAVVAAGMMAMAGAASAQEQFVVGGGATLPQHLYNDTFTLTDINGLPGFEAYIGVGSGAGKRAFFNNDATEFGLASGITVDYAGSDSLVSSTEAANYKLNDEPDFGPLIQIPSVLTSVTVPYNVPGVLDLNLTSEQLAAIFSGAVTNWEDVGGPDLDITVVYRQDGSGTTEIFTRHLAARSSAFTADNVFWEALGHADESDLDTRPGNYLPSNDLGTEGSAGVPQVVYSIPGAIGYVSPDYTDEDDNTKVARINGLLPTQVNVQAAIETVPVPTADEDRQNPLAWGISNPNPSAGYSIVASTNLILSQCYESEDDTASIRDALTKLYNGTWNSKIVQHGFIPLPPVWANAITATFLNHADPLELSVGNPAECPAGFGRPIGDVD